MSETTTKKALSVIATDQHGALMPADHGQLYRMAEQLANSSLVPKALQGKPADVFLVFQMGAELGLAQTQALKSIHVINGTPAMSAETMGALVFGSGLCEDQVVKQTGEGDTMAVHVKVKRKGIATPHESTFTMAEAKKAGVTGNPNWQKWPWDMLAARAKARAYRILFPDVVKGMSAVEEAMDFTPRTASATSRMSTMAQTTDGSAPSPALRRKVVEADPETVVDEQPPPPPPAGHAADSSDF